MRIAYVCFDWGVPVFGSTGSSIHVQEIVRGFLARGARVELFAARIGGDLPAGLETVPVHSFEGLVEGSRAAREQLAFAANRDLRAALEREGPFDMVYERYSLWSFAAMDFARETEVPGLLEVNAPLIEQQAQYRGLVDRACAEHVAERVFDAAAVLIALSTEIKVYLERYPSTHGRVHVIPNGVNPDRFSTGLKPSCPCKPGTFTVGFLGSLKPWHGLPILVDAFAMLHQCHPNSRLLVVGNGPERASLEIDVARRGLTQAVHLTGAVPPEEVPRLLASMDVGVAPYPELPTFYFSPLKVYEYMAAGLPVVASRIGQLAYLIQHGLNGLHCAPGDSSAFADALVRLKQESKLCTSLGGAAREHVIRNHTWGHVIQNILHLAGLKSNSSAVKLGRASRTAQAPVRRARSGKK